MSFLIGAGIGLMGVGMGLQVAGALNQGAWADWAAGSDADNQAMQAHLQRQMNEHAAAYYKGYTAPAQLASQRVAYAASGVREGTGTPNEAGYTTAKLQAYQERLTAIGANMQIDQLTSQASMTRAMGGYAQSAGKVNALTSLISGAGNMMSLWAMSPGKTGGTGGAGGNWTNPAGSWGNATGPYNR